MWSVIHIALVRSLAAYINASELLVGSVEGSGQYSMMIKRLLGCAYLKLPGGKYGEFCVQTWMKLSVTGAYQRERKEPRTALNVKVFSQNATGA